ncbi:MAG TPA: hypothetical protein PLB81_01135 [Deltaproteobacteria bacterium]|nr:hypothetical protein [Deltaproteobacteria bacterium]
MAPALRALSNASRLWLAAGNLNPPIANQFVFEGRGVFDVPLWRKAVDTVAAANSGVRLTLQGHLGCSRWVDSGLSTPLAVVEAPGWDGRGSDRAPFLNGGFPCRGGSMAEVLLIPGDPARVIFRSHHATMDGRGTFTWAEDVFRALRGENMLASDVGIIEDDLLNIGPGPAGKPISQRFVGPRLKPPGAERGIIWRRLTIQGRFARLLPQVMVLTAREIRSTVSGPVRFGIPVDLRSRRENIRSTGNLSNALFMEVDPADTVEDLARELAQRLRERRDGQVTWEDKVVRYLPLKVLEAALRIETRHAHRTGNYRCSGLISNVGRADLGSFYGGGFTAENYWAVPVCLESIPISIVMTGVGETVNLLLAMPRALATYEDLNGILGRLASGLAPAQDI